MKLYLNKKIAHRPFSSLLFRAVREHIKAKGRYEI